MSLQSCPIGTFHTNGISNTWSFVPFSFSIVFTHIVTCIKTSFTLMIDKYSIEGIYHSLIIYWSVDGRHLCSFYLLCISCSVVSNSLRPVDCSQPGSSEHRILHARILEGVASSFSSGSSWPRDRTQVSHNEGRFITIWATKEALIINNAAMNIHVQACLFVHLFIVMDISQVL